MASFVLEDIFKTTNYEVLPNNIIKVYDLLDMSGEICLELAKNNIKIYSIESIFITMLITSEYSTGTIKDSVFLGFSRGKIYMSKLITVSVGSILMMLVAIFTTAITSIFVFGIYGSFSMYDLLLLVNFSPTVVPHPQAVDIRIAIAAALCYLILCSGIGGCAFKKQDIE